MAARRRICGSAPRLRAHRPHYGTEKHDGRNPRHFRHGRQSPLRRDCDRGGAPSRGLHSERLSLGRGRPFAERLERARMAPPENPSRHPADSPFCAESARPHFARRRRREGERPSGGAGLHRAYGARGLARRRLHHDGGRHQLHGPHCTQYRAGGGIPLAGPAAPREHPDRRGASHGNGRHGDLALLPHGRHRSDGRGLGCGGYAHLHLDCSPADEFAFG